MTKNSTFSATESPHMFFFYGKTFAKKAKLKGLKGHISVQIKQKGQKTPFRPQIDVIHYNWIGI